MLKTEQMTIVYAQWDRWASYDVIKHMIITDVIIRITLTHFMPRVSFYTPWKHQKTKDLPMFSGGIERDQWDEIG